MHSSEQPEFLKGPRQIAMLMARVAEFHQGEALQLAQRCPAVVAQLKAQLGAGVGQHSGWLVGLLPGLCAVWPGQLLGLAGGEAAGPLQEVCAQALNGFRVIIPGQQFLALSVFQLTPVLELEFHACKIELAPHCHRDAAQIGGEVGLESEAGDGE